MTTKQPYIIEKFIIKENTSILQEAFLDADIPNVVEKIANVLSKRLGVSINLNPFPFKSSLGGMAYVAVLDDDPFNSAITLEFNGQLNRIGLLGSIDNTTVTQYITLENPNGNIIGALDEVEQILDNFLTTGNFTELLEEKYLREAKASNVFEEWKEAIGKDDFEDLLVNERLSRVYNSEFLLWAEQNNKKVISLVSFFNFAKEYLKKNRLENIFARKTVILNKKGKVEVIDEPQEEKSWRDMLTGTYEESLSLLRKSLDAVIAGGYNSLIVTGGAGTGKSYQVEKMLKDSNVSYFTMSGAIKDVRALVQVLHDHKDGELIVMDDVDIRNKDFRNILLAALDSYDKRVISYFDTRVMNKGDRAKGKVPEQFEFTSGVIFISNLPASKLDSAIRSRSVVIDIDLNPEERMSMIFNNLHSIVPSLPMPVKEEVFEFLMDNINTIEEISFRMFKMVLGMYLSCNGKDWKGFALKIIKQGK